MSQDYFHKLIIVIEVTNEVDNLLLILFDDFFFLPPLFTCAVVVFNLLAPGNISKALCGEQVGTLIDQTGAIS